MHAQDQHLPVLFLDERFLQAALAGAQRFDFGARKRDARLVGVLDEIVVVSLLILGDQFETVSLCHGHAS